MKTYTSISQSEILAKLLPLDSADMYYDVNSYGIQCRPEVAVGKIWNKDIPCWSLGRLLDLIKVNITIEKFEFDQSGEFMYDITYGDCRTTVCSELIDACYELIVKLHTL